MSTHEANQSPPSDTAKESNVSDKLPSESPFTPGSRSTSSIDLTEDDSIFFSSLPTPVQRTTSFSKAPARPREWSLSFFRSAFRRKSSQPQTLDPSDLNKLSDFEFDDICPKLNGKPCSLSIVASLVDTKVLVGLEEDLVALNERDLQVKDDLYRFFSTKIATDSQASTPSPFDPPLLPTQNSDLDLERHESTTPITNAIDTNTAIAWNAPNSWAVMPTSFDLQPFLMRPRRKHSRPTDIQAEQYDLEVGLLWSIRVFKPNSREDQYGRKASHTYVNISCPVDMTVGALCRVLYRQFDSRQENLNRFRLFSVHSGSERLLANNDRPVAILKKWLEDIGYKHIDNLHMISRQDHSHLFRFIYHEFPLPPPKPELGNELVEIFTSDGKCCEQKKINPKSVFLADENLSVVPVSVFRHAKTIEYMDLSRNTVLELPKDLFEQMEKLRLLRLIGNLLGAVPQAIATIPALTHLDLSCNSLIGTGLEILGSCHTLVSLNLSCNNIEYIPDKLGELKNLRHIDLSSNYLVDFPKTFWSLLRLREIDLSFNSIASIPDQIESLKCLQRLILLGNSVRSVSPRLAKLELLRYLDLRANLVEDVGKSFSIGSLSELSASYTHLRFLDVSNATNITSISACHNPMSTFTVSTLLPQLRSLILGVCKLSLFPDNFFSFMPSLEVLQLERNQLTELPDLSCLTKLRILRVYNNDLVEFEGNFTQLSNLVYLDLHGNNLKLFPSDLWSLPSLKILNLSSNFICNIPFPEHQPNSITHSLEELYFAENRLTNHAIINLASLTNLKILNLSYNQITELGNTLRHMSSLYELYISGNEISSIPDYIDTLQSLHVFFANDNKLTHIPGEVCKLDKLIAVDFSRNNLKYNISNFPFDWNWNFNTQLVYLNLSHNKRLDFNPTITATHEIVNLHGFANLKKIRFLKVCNVGVPPPKLPTESLSFKIRKLIEPCENLNAGFCEYFGRDMLFDQHELIQSKFMGQQDDHLIGLFDGRGSDTVSLFLKDSMGIAVVEQFKTGATNENLNVEDCLRRAFLSANRDLSMQPVQMSYGASATIIYIMANRLYIANVGDTMAILSKDGVASILTTKHHPWSRSEQERIRKIGGFISSDGLVERELNITRAIGHHHLLPYVNANPSTMMVQLSPKDEFVLLASQSFWRCIKYQVAVDAARALRHDPDMATQKLRDMALAVGGSKSMTIIFISLQSICKSEDENFNAIELRRKAFRTVSETQALARLEAEIPPPRSPCVYIFTDIKDSTQLWRTDPKSMRVSLKIHNDLLRRLLRNHSGYEVKNEGDALMAAFRDVVTAVRWCCSVQAYLLEADWPEEILQTQFCASEYSETGRLLFRGLTVRMGIHYGASFGEPDPTTGRMDYFGAEVIVASRLSSLALGGEILISDTVYNMFQAIPLADKSDFSAVFYSLGPLNLKGFPDGYAAYSAYPEGLSERHRLRKNLDQTSFQSNI